MQVTLPVNDPRPVQKAMRELESRLGRVITYEDPPYEEVTDVTAEVRRTGNARERVLVPRQGRLDITVDVQPGSPASLKKAIEQVLSASVKAGNAGEFRVAQEGDVLHVIPTSPDGGAPPLLDTPIDLDGVERS